MIHFRIDSLILILQAPLLIFGTALIWHNANFGVAAGAFLLALAASIRRTA